MKEARADRRRVTLRYRHDEVTARSVLVIDVESPEDEMPHEHKQDLKSLAAEVLGVPIEALPAEVEVRLRSRHAGHHEGDPEHEHEAEGQRVEGPARAAVTSRS
ncbi:MAG: hypothetical protein JNK72_01700 [Myxococcales bacterium]|nr:hypothetical protein [Myxococcales bacterium]